MSRLEFVPAGEPFELGFGPDLAICTTRQMTEQRETTPVIGTQKLVRTVTISLTNTSDTPRSLRIFERIPVSELSEVSVSLLEDGGGQMDKDGRLVIPLTLQPGDRRRLLYRWRLEATAKVTLGSL